MTFTTTKLVGSRVMVSGTDVNGVAGQAILDSSQWDEIAADQAFSQAEKDFEAAAEAFFAPLVAAAEKVGKQLERKDDPISYVVLQDEVEATPGQRRQLVKLTKDSIVLRLLEQGDTNRLVWVNGEIEVTEVLPGSPSVPTSDQLLNGVPAENLGGL